MTLQDLTPGIEIIFTPTGESFKIAKISKTRVSWYVDFQFKGGTGKNTLQGVWVTKKSFQKGIDEGTYKLKTEL